MSSQIITLTLKNLKKIWLEREIPNISEENAEYLKKLIQEKNPKHILEIGTANGYSTLQFASVFFESSSSTPLSENEKSEVKSITTIEQAWNMHIDAVTNFKNCKTKNIHAIWWDARVVIPALADNFFDFIYIDAMKKEYLDYLLLTLPKMTSGALIVVDDVVKFRDKMQNLYDFLDENTIHYTIMNTDPDDGIMLLTKNSFSWKI